MSLTFSEDMYVRGAEMTIGTAVLDAMSEGDDKLVTLLRVFLEEVKRTAEKAGEFDELCTELSIARGDKERYGAVVGKISKVVDALAD